MTNRAKSSCNLREQNLITLAEIKEESIGWEAWGVFFIVEHFLQCKLENKFFVQSRHVGLSSCFYHIFCLFRRDLHI